ncbi:MAG: recombinase family protein [Anaerotignaceae bacterium]
MDKKVKKIEPVRQKVLQKLQPKQRVCAYCRVSTDSTKQHTSYVAQAEYYKTYIENHHQWEFVGIFADEASGTKLKNRDEFNRMISECEKQNIDLIITKSITRFARNTLDSIETIRKLKSLGIAVYFEKENINTLNEQSELMLTIFSSIAQGEAESMSTNNRWGIQKRFRDGSFIPSCLAYGYTKDKDGQIIINEDEAQIVRKIFEKYLSGKGSYVIARELNDEDIPTVRSGEKWYKTVVKEILQNPIYHGTLLLQKTYTTDMLPFTKKKNNGEMIMYSIEDSHPPIITKEQAQRVKEIYAYRRVQSGIDESRKKINRYEFSSKILCNECGSVFRRQKIYIGKPYEKIQWCCVKHIQNISQCSMQAVREDVIKIAFLTMWNKLVSNYADILYPFLESLKELRLDNKHQDEILELNNKITQLMEQSHILSRVVLKGYMDSAIFMEKQTELNIQIEEYKRKRNSLLTNNGYERQIEGTLRILQIIKYNPTIIDDYQEELFANIVDKVLISKKGNITFKLINDLELTEVG